MDFSCAVDTVYFFAIAISVVTYLIFWLLDRLYPKVHFHYKTKTWIVDLNQLQIAQLVDVFDIDSCFIVLQCVNHPSIYKVYTSALNDQQIDIISTTDDDCRNFCVFAMDRIRHDESNVNQVGAACVGTSVRDRQHIQKYLLNSQSSLISSNAKKIAFAPQVVVLLQWMQLISSEQSTTLLRHDQEVDEFKKEFPSVTDPKSLKNSLESQKKTIIKFLHNSNIVMKIAISLMDDIEEYFARIFSSSSNMPTIKSIQNNLMESVEACASQMSVVDSKFNEIIKQLRELLTAIYIKFNETKEMNVEIVNSQTFLTKSAQLVEQDLNDLLVKRMLATEKYSAAKQVYLEESQMNPLMIGDHIIDRPESLEAEENVVQSLMESTKIYRMIDEKSDEQAIFSYEWNQQLIETARIDSESKYLHVALQYVTKMQLIWQLFYNQFQSTAIQIRHICDRKLLTYFNLIDGEDLGSASIAKRRRWFDCAMNVCVQSTIIKEMIRTNCDCVDNFFQSPTIFDHLLALSLSIPDVAIETEAALLNAAVQLLATRNADKFDDCVEDCLMQIAKKFKTNLAIE